MSNIKKAEEDLGYWGKLFVNKRQRAAAIAALVEQYPDEVKEAVAPKQGKTKKPVTV